MNIEYFWSCHLPLYADGVFYDPEHVILDDFSESARKDYWEFFSDTLPFVRVHCNNAVYTHRAD